MLHTSDSSKDFTTEVTSSWAGLDTHSRYAALFYEIKDLKKDGFIHKNGTLKFQFSIRKHNFKKRALAAE